MNKKQNQSDRIAALEETIAFVIDKFNTVKAQNIAMNLALAGFYDAMPADIRERAANHYDHRCAQVQIVVNDGRTDLSALAIQRTEFAAVRKKIFSGRTC